MIAMDVSIFMQRDRNTNLSRHFHFDSWYLIFDRLFDGGVVAMFS